jgi:hypothetical protein
MLGLQVIDDFATKRNPAGLFHPGAEFAGPGNARDMSDPPDPDDHTITTGCDSQINAFPMLYGFATQGKTA